MSWTLRALIAVVVFWALIQVFRALRRRAGSKEDLPAPRLGSAQDPHFASLARAQDLPATKLGKFVVFVALTLMVPTTSTFTWGMPGFTGPLAGLIIGLLIGLALFCLLGVLGIAGGFGALKLGLGGFLGLFGGMGTLGSTFAAIFKWTPVGMISPWIWGPLLVLGLLLWGGPLLKRERREGGTSNFTSP
jgi:hypothetical protein